MFLWACLGCKCSGSRAQAMHYPKRGSLKRSARAVRAQCNYLGVRPY